MGESAADALAVRIEALVKRYGRVTALDGVSLEIARREAFGLLGANGAGKTTLIRCLLDLTAADAGTIRIFGRSSRQPASRASLAYLPERFTPPHYLSAANFSERLPSLTEWRMTRRESRSSSISWSSSAKRWRAPCAISRRA